MDGHRRDLVETENLGRGGGREFEGRIAPLKKIKLKLSSNVD